MTMIDHVCNVCDLIRVCKVCADMSVAGKVVAIVWH
jgi:hypothetical protein